MAAVLLATIVWHERRTGNILLAVSWRPSLERIRRLAGLGMPAAMQILFEGVVFGLVSVFAAHLDEVSLAAHSIAINVVSTTYMVPLGISSAAAVRVGQAYGAGDTGGAATRGWTAILLGALFMGGAGVLLGVAPRWIVRIYTADAAVIASGAVLSTHRRLVPIVRRLAGGGHRRAARPRRHPHAHAGASGRLLGYRPARGVPVVFSVSLGRHGIWVGLSAALILIGSALVRSGSGGQ